MAADHILLLSGGPAVSATLFVVLIFLSASGIIHHYGKSVRSMDCEILPERNEPTTEAGSIKVSRGRFEPDVWLPFDPARALRSHASAIFGGTDGGFWVTAGELPWRTTTQLKAGCGRRNDRAPLRRNLLFL